MNISKKELSKAQIEFTIEVSPEETKPYLIKAAEIISTEKSIAGFRPGKAPYDVVKKEVGEMTIYQHAADNIIGKTLYEVLEKELPNTDVVGSPQINIEKMAPDNPLVYKAIITLLPEVTLDDYSKIKVAKKDVKIDSKEIETILTNLQNIHAKETVKLGPLEKGDKVNVNFDVFVDGVAIEGGSSKNFPLVIGEGRFIPGFEEQIVGMSQNENKEFELRFPEDYHAKNLAGKLAKFKVEVKETFKRELPELNNDFAKTLGGYQTIEDVRKGIEHNLLHEAEEKENQKQEIEMLDELIKIAKFSELPESMIHAEAHKMIHELEHSIEHQGLKFEDYLKHLKKTEQELEKEILPEAKKRVQTALIARKVADQNKLWATDEEIDKELEEIKKVYGQSPEVADNLSSPGYRRYLATSLTNRKVIEHLKKEIIK
ncbi:MAG: trigger factor [Patescibacteria group bacterium]|jgi:trigger factor